MKNIFFLALILALISCEDKTERSDAYGNFDATATTVSTETGGQLIKLDVEEGNRIEEGAMVALVDTTQLHLQRLQIKATINALPKKLRTALADIAVLQNRKSNLIRERDRLARLVAKKAATSKQLDDLNGEIEVIDKQMTAVRSQIDTGNRAILSEKEPLLAQIAIIEHQIDKSYIYNPVSGIVLTKLSEAHEVVRPGTALYRIADLDTITLRFYADAVQVQDVRIGDEIQILVDNGEEGYQEHNGTITWIAEQAEFTPKTIQTKEDRVNLVYALKASVPNADHTLKMGMPAEVNFEPRDLTAYTDEESN